MYSDEDAAALYDRLNTWGPGDDFYLGLVMKAGSVLDVGCGTGAILRRAREAGHAGRLCGLDPDLAALGVARRRTDVDWVAGSRSRRAIRSRGRGRNGSPATRSTWSMQRAGRSASGTRSSR